MTTQQPKTPRQVVAARVRALRDRHGWSQDELAARLIAHGMTAMSRTAVVKIETGARDVRVDDLLALAFVLGVPPAALFVPDRDDEVLLVTPSTSMPVENAWSWATGRRADGGGRPGEVLHVERDAAELDARKVFYKDATPGGLRLREAEQLERVVERIAATFTEKIPTISLLQEEVDE